MEMDRLFLSDNFTIECWKANKSSSAQGNQFQASKFYLLEVYDEIEPRLRTVLKQAHEYCPHEVYVILAGRDRGLIR